MRRSAATASTCVTFELHRCAHDFHRCFGHRRKYIESRPIRRATGAARRPYDRGIPRTSRGGWYHERSGAQRTAARCSGAALPRDRARIVGSRGLAARRWRRRGVPESTRSRDPHRERSKSGDLGAASGCLSGEHAERRLDHFYMIRCELCVDANRSPGRPARGGRRRWRAGEPRAQGRRARAGRGRRVTRAARRWSSNRTNSARWACGRPRRVGDLDVWAISARPARWAARWSRRRRRPARGVRPRGAPRRAGDGAAAALGDQLGPELVQLGGDVARPRSSRRPGARAARRGRRQPRPWALAIALHPRTTMLEGVIGGGIEPLRLVTSLGGRGSASLLLQPRHEPVAKSTLRRLPGLPRSGCTLL